MYDGRNCESGCTLQTDLNVYNRDKTEQYKIVSDLFVTEAEQEKALEKALRESDLSDLKK